MTCLPVRPRLAVSSAGVSPFPSLIAIVSENQVPIEALRLMVSGDSTMSAIPFLRQRNLTVISYLSPHFKPSRAMFRVQHIQRSCA